MLRSPIFRPFAVPWDDTSGGNTELVMSFQTMELIATFIARCDSFRVQSKRREREIELLPLNDKCRTSSTHVHNDQVCPCKAKTAFIPPQVVYTSSENTGRFV
jgi:hypothetical protein